MKNEIKIKCDNDMEYNKLQIYLVDELGYIWNSGEKRYWPTDYKIEKYGIIIHLMDNKKIMISKAYTVIYDYTYEEFMEGIGLKENVKNFVDNIFSIEI
jgi:hypothetical protein